MTFYLGICLFLLNARQPSQVFMDLGANDAQALIGVKESLLLT